MSEDVKPYGIAYIASAPQEIRVGDKIVVNDNINVDPQLFGRQGIVTQVNSNHTLLVKIGDCSYILDEQSVGKVEKDAKGDVPWNVAMFRQITDEMAGTYARKNATYNDSFGKSVNKYGFIAALTRMSDKFNRIENLILGAENKVPDESLEDSLLDLACYSVMTIVALRDAKIGDVDFENVN